MLIAVAVEADSYFASLLDEPYPYIVTWPTFSVCFVRQLARLYHEHAVLLVLCLAVVCI